MKSLIVFKEVSYKYPYQEVFAIRDINLEVYYGEVLSIIGSNGAGKTTLIKHMNGLLKPTIGEVFVEGINTKKATIAELSRIVGIVFQNPDYQLFAPSVYEEISFSLKNFGYNEEKIKEKVKQMLDFFYLSNYSDVSPLLLSGGEKKRVSLASVLVYDPKVLVLDEPTIGLDFVQKSNLKSIIEELKRKGKTTVIVTHDLDFVAEVSDRVAVMHEGRIIKIGEAREVIYEEEFLEKANLRAPSIVKLAKSIMLKEKVLRLEELLEKFETIYSNVQT